MLSHTICTRSRPDDALDAVLQVTRSAQAVSGGRGEATEAIGQLLALLETNG